MTINLEPDIGTIIAGQAVGDPFDYIMNLRGEEELRHHKNRRTIRVNWGGRDFYIKQHRPTAWREILKNALRFRWPVLTAQPEVRAIQQLGQLDIPTTPLAGWGVRGNAPHKLESFLITRGLVNMIDLEELAKQWNHLPEHVRQPLKRRLIEQLAIIAKTLHDNGLNHRDFYLCHFMLTCRDWSNWSPGDGTDLDVHVIDLHRMQQRKRTPRKWVIKDLSGLLFSAMIVPLTRADQLRFLRMYWGRDNNWRETFRRSRVFLATINWRARKLFLSHHGRPPESAADHPSCAESA